MSSDLKIQGEVQLSTEGVESALNRVGEKAGQMASRLQTEAGKAGKAVDSIGEGAENSAEQFSRAEGKIVASIKRATTSLEQMGKTASQKLEIKIASQGLDTSRFEPMLAKLRELEAAQNRVVGSSRGFGSGLQNTSYQLQDFIVQVNGGTEATKALGQQLPQMLVGFGAAGAAVGVLAALLPNLVSAFSTSAAGAKDFKDAMSDFDKAIGAVGQATKTFDMDKLYEEFNSSSAAVRAATIEQLNFQREYIRTTQLVSEKKFGESLSGLGQYSTLDKLAGAYAGTGAEKLAKQLGITLDVAKDLLPALNGLRSGTEDIGLAFNQFGTKLLGGNQKAVDLAESMATLAKSEKEAAAASTALTEAQAKMAKGHVATKKETEASKKATEELASLLDRINGKQTGLDPKYWENLETLHTAYKGGRLTIDQYREAVGKLTNEQKFATDAAKAELEAIKARSDFLGRIVSDEQRRTDSAFKANESLRDEIAMLGLSKEQQTLYKAAKLDTASASDLLAAKELEEAAAHLEVLNTLPEVAQKYRLLAEAKRASAAALGEEASLSREKAAKDVAVEQAKEAAKAWENFSRDIERSLTDSLMRGFERGESFGESFVKSLRNTLKTAALKVVVQAIVSPVMGAAGQAFGYTGTGAGVGGAGGGGFGGLQQAGGMYNSFGGGGFSIGNLVGSAGNYMGNGYVSAYGAGMNMTAAQAEAASQAYASAGAEYAGYGEAISSGSSIGSSLGSYAGYAGALYSASQGRYGAAAGAAIGTMIMPGIGTLIGSMLGGLLDGSGRGTTRGSANYTTTYTPGMGSATSLFASEKGDLASLGGVASAYTDSLQALYKRFAPDAGFTSSLVYSLNPGGKGPGGVNAEIFDTMGTAPGWRHLDIGQTDQAAVVKMWDKYVNDYVREFAKSSKIDASTRDTITLMLDLGYAADKVATQFDSFTSLLEKMPGVTSEVIKDLQKPGEALADAFSRIANSVFTVDDILRQFGKETTTLSAANKAATADVFGGPGNLASASQSYIQNFYTDEERKVAARGRIDSTLKALGLTNIPTTANEFRSLVEAQDLATESGRKMFASLIAVSDAFASVTGTADQAASAMSTDLFRSREDYIYAKRTGIMADYSASQIDVAALLTEIAGMRSDMRIAMAEQARANKKTAKILDLWDADGMPTVRTL